MLTLNCMSCLVIITILYHHQYHDQYNYHHNHHKNYAIAVRKMEIMPNGRHVENKNSCFVMPQDKDTRRTVQPELPA